MAESTPSSQDGVADAGIAGGTGRDNVAPTLARHIEMLRRNLLDIGTRNRLVSAPLRSTRANVLEVIDEKADRVFAALWREGTSFTFAPNDTMQPAPPPGQPPADEDDASPVPIYIPVEEPTEGGVAARHKDNRLQTRLQVEPLQKRLLALQRDSILFEEEQGANILFFAIGFLKWVEAEGSDSERYAPLLLVPVSLERDRVRSRFRLRRRDDDIEVNLSLQAKLKQDFGLDLPELPEGEDWQPSDYVAAVEQAIATKAQWRVERDAMLLGFFSFSKFLIYRDLDPDVWPEAAGLDRNALVAGLLSQGFDEAPLPIGETQNLDALLAPAELGHVLDADSSQAAVVKMAADGRSMVVQGPPGTGKSQTIANLIAAAARQGKSILFVAEKMAALQVVHDRLRASGLDALCLELHSHKANKKAVLEELERTLELGRVTGGTSDIAVDVKHTRDRLNALSALLHTPMDGLSESPFRTIAALVHARDSGLAPPDFTLDVEKLKGAAEAAHAASALEVLANRTAAAGPSARHPWRGVARRLTPVERDRLGAQLPKLRSKAAELQAAMARGAALLGGLNGDVAGCETDLLRWLDHFGRMPGEMPSLLEQEALRRDPARARALLDAADAVAKALTEASTHTSDVGLAQDWSAVRLAIASRGKSFFRFLSGEFRRSVALLDSVSLTGPTKGHDERLRRLDAIMAVQLATRQLAAEDERGRAVFGRHWQGQQTNTADLMAAVDWYAAGQSLPGASDLLDAAIRAVTESGAVAAAAADVKSLRQSFEEIWAAVTAALGLDVLAAFDDANAPPADSRPGVTAIDQRAALWIAALDRLEEWFGVVAAEGACRAAGLDPIVDRLASGALDPALAAAAWRYARAEAMWGHMIARVPDLATLRGDERSSLVAQFRDLERKLFVATAGEVAARHAEGLPSGAQGEMGFIRGQIARRRGHASIRRLMENAGRAVQRIKPVFLMSPISVAQFLPPGSVAFDLVLMDEASQMRPEDAIGAIARGGSVVVVGDSKQLPPTSFFDRTLGDSAEAPDDDSGSEGAATVAAGAMESILTLCQARGLPARTLQWHYRSRHPSLIEVSNQAFYENKLKFPPSPERAGRDGLVFRRVAGVYDRGKTRTNALEARAVAEAAIAHARETPDLSLGVATLSVPQRDAILAQLELLRADHPDLESFFDRARADPFFVKNLENVQGDERDVIFVSICYARDAAGYMAQGFGPVSSTGGERRLNVLFTRARRRCEIFASIGHGDIELRGAMVPVGRRVLHAYLKFAETGQTDAPAATGREADSEFEIAVGNRIRSAGYEVDYQVGSAGFRIDIGVRDPASANAYLLGVECDGATYHSALWARERDRLRQQVLESKGWRLHRIWSTDWFNRPADELAKLLAALSAAKAAHASDLEAEREERKARETAIRIERDSSPAAAAISVPYVEADVAKIAAYDEAHLVPAGAMARYVTAVVTVEQPVHADEVARRVARAWGAQRAGSRIRASVDKALATAKADGKLSGGPFWSTPDGAVRVRDRSAVESTTLRQPANLPPAEIDLAIVEAVERSIAISPDEAARAVAEALGFAALSAQLRAVVLERVRELVSETTLSEKDGLLRRET
jgi:very-short-patch-repair endonuclease